MSISLPNPKKHALMPLVCFFFFFSEISFVIPFFFGRFSRKGENEGSHDDKFSSFINKWKLWYQSYGLLFKKECAIVRADLKFVIFLEVEINDCIHGA